jgi:Fur family peroxide stress response transcriptional regulator
MQRSSKQKKAILRVLLRSTSHPSADWIYEEVRKEISNISLGTVYRNLNILKEEGSIVGLSFADAPSRYDGNLEPHYHFRCVKCGRFFDIDQPVKSDLYKEVVQDSGFEVLGHRLEFYGFCPDCGRGNEQVKLSS